MCELIQFVLQYSNENLEEEKWQKIGIILLMQNTIYLK